MKCTRVGGCLKELTKNWASPQECPCEVRERIQNAWRIRERAILRKEHQSDIEFVNQNARGK